VSNIVLELRLNLAASGAKYVYTLEYDWFKPGDVADFPVHAGLARVLLAQDKVCIISRGLRFGCRVKNTEGSYLKEMVRLNPPTFFYYKTYHVYDNHQAIVVERVATGDVTASIKLVKYVRHGH
jgi:hypothetical protein